MTEYYLPRSKGAIGREVIINLPEIDDSEFKCESLESRLSETLGQNVSIKSVEDLGDEVYGLFLSNEINSFGKMLTLAKVPGKVIVENVTRSNKHGHQSLGSPR